MINQNNIFNTASFDESTSEVIPKMQSFMNEISSPIKDLLDAHLDYAGIDQNSANAINDILIQFQAFPNLNPKSNYIRQEESDMRKVNKPNDKFPNAVVGFADFHIQENEYLNKLGEVSNALKLYSVQNFGDKEDLDLVITRDGKIYGKDKDENVVQDSQEHVEASHEQKKQKLPDTIRVALQWDTDRNEPIKLAFYIDKSLTETENFELHFHDVESQRPFPMAMQQDIDDREIKYNDEGNEFIVFTNTDIDGKNYYSEQKFVKLPDSFQNGTGQTVWITNKTWRKSGFDTE